VTPERPAAPSLPAAAGGLPERIAVPLAFLAGAGVGLQAYVNGKLSGAVHSTLLASLLSFGVGLVALLGLAATRGTLSAARARLRGMRRPPLWYFAGGLGGAYLVTSTAAAAPEIGVALVTVALVAGQTGGSLGVDAAGLGPSGTQAVTARRLAGVGLAVVAVLLSALAGGGRSDPHVGLLLLVALAGVGVAFQQAANGRLQQVSGDAIVAALLNFLIGTVVLGVLLAATHPSGTTLAAPPLYYAGGLLGAGFVLTAAATVRVLGVLRLSLIAIAGQSAGALVLDAVDPAPGRHLSWATLVGVALTIAAVGVSRR
jgi:bacterial/archaeal transporter family-2 protein